MRILNKKYIQNLTPFSTKLPPPTQPEALGCHRPSPGLSQQPPDQTPCSHPLPSTTCSQQSATVLQLKRKADHVNPNVVWLLVSLEIKARVLGLICPPHSPYLSQFLCCDSSPHSPHLSHSSCFLFLKYPWHQSSSGTFFFSLPRMLLPRQQPGFFSHLLQAVCLTSHLLNEVFP